MEMNHYKCSTTNSWELELAMEDDQIILHDQNKLPLPTTTTLWPNPYPLHQDHHYQIPSSSLTQLPSSSPHHYAYHQQNQNINQTQTDQARQADVDQDEELGAMKKMMFKIAAMQPVDIDPSTIRKPKRRNVRISDDPQSVAARHRRERISEKIRILQRLVPGGTKMDTASMLEEAGRYIKFLKRQIRQLEDTHQSQCIIGVMSNLAVPPTNVTYNSGTAAGREHV